MVRRKNLSTNVTTMNHPVVMSAQSLLYFDILAFVYAPPVPAVGNPKPENMSGLHPGNSWTKIILHACRLNVCMLLSLDLLS